MFGGEKYNYDAEKAKAAKAGKLQTLIFAANNHEKLNRNDALFLALGVIPELPENRLIRAAIIRAMYGAE